MDAQPSLWIVLDNKDGPEFAAAWREGAHEHIKDCLDEGVHEASRWVVREYVPIAEVERLRAEVEALKAKAAAFDEWYAKTEWVQETATPLEIGMHRADVMRMRIEALKTVMVAAAEEIHAHWGAHCDLEGYGPANLMRRLEEGIPAEYGYTAGAFASLRAEAEALRADLTRTRGEFEKAWPDAERYRWLRNAAGRGAAGSIFDNFNGSAVDECIDAARAAQGEKT